MLEKLQWQVLSGEDVNIWRDRWVNGETLQATAMIDQDLTQVAAELISEDREH